MGPNYGFGFSLDPWYNGAIMGVVNLVMMLRLCFLYLDSLKKLRGKGKQRLLVCELYLDSRWVRLTCS